MSSTAFFLYVTLMVFCSQLLCSVWPDLKNPVAENTARIMDYGGGLWGPPSCGTRSDSFLYNYFFHDLVLISFMAYIGFETSRCVLAKQVFEPLATSCLNRPTFRDFAKFCILLLIVLGFNLVTAETFVKSMTSFHL